MGYSNRKLKLRGYYATKDYGNIQWVVEEPPRFHPIFWSGEDHGKVDTYNIPLPWLYYSMAYTNPEVTRYNPYPQTNIYLNGIGITTKQVKKLDASHPTAQLYLPNVYGYGVCHSPYPLPPDFVEKQLDFSTTKKLAKSLNHMSNLILINYWGQAFNWDGELEDDSNFDMIAQKLGIAETRERTCQDCAEYGDPCYCYDDECTDRGAYLRAMQGWKIKDVLKLNLSAPGTNLFTSMFYGDVLKSMQKTDGVVAF